jgi:hypothetical protein
VKLEFYGTGCVPPGREEQNLRHTATLGLPHVSEQERPPLAVVGGGHSVLRALDELRAWPGDVWACGSAFHFCVAQGIRATFFCIDPQPETAPLGRGAKHAIVCTSMDPAMFEELKDAKVEIFDLIREEGKMNHWATTATSAPMLAVQMGYRDVSFFGCESSFEQDTHAYRHEQTPEQILVACNGQSFLSHPAYFMQAEYLSAVIRTAPHIFHDRSGGLLAGLIADPDYDITHGTRGLYELVHRERAA